MIIYSITNKLYELFGEGFNIYTDTRVQNMKSPCFFVREINSQVKDYIHKSKGITHLFDITFHSDKDRMDGLNYSLDSIVNKLLIEFEFLEYKNEKYRAFDRKIEKLENEIHFTFCVYEKYRITDEVPLMEKLQMKWM